MQEPLSGLRPVTISFHAPKHMNLPHTAMMQLHARHCILFGLLLDRVCSPLIAALDPSMLPSTIVRENWHIDLLEALNMKQMNSHSCNLESLLAYKYV